ncbi:hypothetical protein T260_09035 [Geobacillus thermopakistaniensis]|uniref:Uncharacterized protein n=1 Tax=Geobacillus thermopakistaniensis (strain MAS1) TaxID=1408282 RepID=A0A7U9JB29_GEOTM|nr:hypothetical protein T260_09035 [Geobacillus sp. MAS1]
MTNEHIHFCRVFPVSHLGVQLDKAVMLEDRLDEPFLCVFRIQLDVHLSAEVDQLIFLVMTKNVLFLLSPFTAIAE